MAFEDVAEAIDKFWKPEEKGDNVEGNVFKIEKDQWDNDRIVLDLGDDENGQLMTTTLPAHASLQRFIPNIGVGDYIKVTLIDLIEPESDKEDENGNKIDEDGKILYPTYIYKVQKDPDRAVDY